MKKTADVAPRSVKRTCDVEENISYFEWSLCGPDEMKLDFERREQV